MLGKFRLTALAVVLLVVFLSCSVFAVTPKKVTIGAIVPTLEAQF